MVACKCHKLTVSYNIVGVIVLMLYNTVSIYNGSVYKLILTPTML
jgi:hypothetical protein